MSTLLPLMKNVLTPLAKKYSLPLGLAAATSVTNAAIQKTTSESAITHKICETNSSFHVK